jgi:hypothetical protein
MNIRITASFEFDLAMLPDKDLQAGQPRCWRSTTKWSCR